MGFLSGIQFISPWLLAGYLLAPILVYAYLRKTPQRKTIVSSLVVLRTLARREAPKTKFKPPLRFFLELIALLSLCLAAAMPVQTDSRRRAALLIDNSLSMRALDNTGRTPGTRLERAKDAARKWLAEQRSTTTIDLFASSPRLTRIGPESQSLADAEAGLDGIKAASAPDNLEAEIEELGDTGTYERVVAVSDKTIEYREEQQEGTLNSNESPQKKYTRTVGIAVGERVANTFISGFSLVQGALSEGGAKLVATVSASGPADRIALVIFSESAVNETVLQSTSVTVTPGRSAEVSFELPQGVNPKAIYRVRVGSSDERATGITDSLAEDNSAWLVPQAGASERILVVSPGTAESSGLDTLSAFSVETISPDEFPARAAAGLEKYSLVVFHRAAPSAPPARPTLLILPPADNTLFPVQQEVRGANVSSWMAEHPIASYLKVQLLNLSAAEIFAVPPWADSVVRAEQGTVVAAGESHGIRFAAVGVELLPFEGAKTPVLSVLTLNLFNWLTGGTQLTGSTLAGSVVRLDPKERWQVREPSGREIVVEGEDTRLTLNEPGAYRVRSPGEERMIAANAFFPDESATYSASAYSAQRVFTHERRLDEGAEPWWPYFLALALSILLLEQLLFILPGKTTA